MIFTSDGGSDGPRYRLAYETLSKRAVEAPSPLERRGTPATSVLISPGRCTAADRPASPYLVYPDGIGRSKLTIRVIEQALGTRGTARNWNTVLTVATACGLAVHRR